MPSPAERVFAVAELAEPILLQQDARELFLLQRVNRDFRRLIATSERTQQKCYLVDAAPSSTPDLEYALTHFRSHLCMQPFSFVAMSAPGDISIGQKQIASDPSLKPPPRFQSGRIPPRKQNPSPRARNPGPKSPAPSVPPIKASTLCFSCTVQFHDHGKVAVPPTGFRGLRKMHGTHQSWARMRLNRQASAIQVKIRVRVDNNGVYKGEYVEYLDLCHGPWTLGDLLSAMSHIPRRPLEDHLRRLSVDPTVTTIRPQQSRCAVRQGTWEFGTGLAPGPEHDKFAFAAATSGEGKEYCAWDQTSLFIARQGKRIFAPHGLEP